MNDVGRILDSLKPCPFCGGKAGRRFHIEGVESPFECIIECSDCGASLEVIDTANDLEATQNLAIDKWNTRIEGTCLLKEQEQKPQKPQKMLEVEDDDLYAWSPKDVSYYCPRPECGKEISYDYNFCPYCGQAVKLDD